MKKLISLVFTLSVIGSPSLAWGWGGEGGCSYSKDKTNQDAKTQEVEETDALIDRPSKAARIFN